MAEATPVVTQTGSSRADDIRVETITFANLNDFAIVRCHGYDYASFIPVGPDGTEPSSGTTSFDVYAVASDAALTVADAALIGAEAGVHVKATVATGPVRTYGYLYRLPMIIGIVMTGGTGSAGLVLRVELRKRKSHAQVVGRG